MKIVGIIVGVLLLVLVIVAGIFFLTKPHNQGNTGNPNGGTGFPIATSTNSGGGTSASQISIVTSDGRTLKVPDFTKAADTVLDPTNKGVYYLSGGLDVTETHASYQIFYNQNDQSFGVTLYKEPLGANRQQAEQELMKILRLNQSDLCSLQYYISAGPGVSDVYSSQNLGFSFCAGAVKLP
jgi:hypothetical protein